MIANIVPRPSVTTVFTFYVCSDGILCHPENNVCIGFDFLEAQLKGSFQQSNRLSTSHHCSITNLNISWTCSYLVYSLSLSDTWTLLIMTKPRHVFPLSLWVLYHFPNLDWLRVTVYPKNLIHQTFVQWDLYILFKFAKYLIRHLGLAIRNVRRVHWFSWKLGLPHWDFSTMSILYNFSGI